MSLLHEIEERGPLTVAAFFDLALYHPTYGYYARAAQRSGRSGDFFTSVDVGPAFGALIARQIVEMARIHSASAPAPAGPFDIVEAGAGNGRLSRDILMALRHTAPELYARAHLSLVEASPAARAAQREVLGDTTDRLVWSDAQLPPTFSGVLLANELLDALPVHQVVMRAEGLREIYVLVRRSPNGLPSLITEERSPSTPALEAYLREAGVTLEDGWTAEINLQASAWVQDASRRLQRGFLLLFDYGHSATELYSARHSSGTLMAFSQHQASGAEAPQRGRPAWLERPGEQDLTAHVDFTSIERAATREGAVSLGLLDQTYFLLGLFQPPAETTDTAAPTVDPFTTLMTETSGGRRTAAGEIKARLALKTLLMPGGLGSTMKVLVLGKGVGTPRLRGCSYRMRVT